MEDKDEILDAKEEIKVHSFFNKKLFSKILVISLIVGIFLAYNQKVSGDFMLAQLVGTVIGSVIGLNLIPLLILSIFSLILKIFKYKLKSKVFWMIYFIIWIFVTILVLFAEYFSSKYSQF